MSFKNFRISRKLTVAFTAIFLVSAGASILVFENLVSISRLNVANRSSLDLSADTESLLEQMVEQQNAVRGFLVSGDEAFIAEYQAAGAAFTHMAEHFKIQTVSAEQRGRVEKLQAFMAGWKRDQAEPQIALRRAPVIRKQPPAVLAGGLPLTEGRAILKEIAEKQATIIADRIVISDKAEMMAKLFLGGSAALEALIAMAMGLLLSRSVGRPISQMTQAMRRLAGGDTGITVPSTDRRDEVGEMAKAVESFKQAAIEQVRLEGEAVAARRSQEAQRDRQSAIDNSKAEDLRVFVHAVEDGFNALSEGDLTVRMEQAVAPEFEPIRATFNDSVGKLEAAMGSVVGAVGAIRVGLSEISVASGDLAQRTEQQAASLEETVAALGEVTHAVNETADSAQRAQATASTAQKNAERGGEVVGRAVEAMNQIEHSSDKIGRIIGVIDEIAFQTNLLALNAGVEAARAGDAGRGFAVVAQEVRGLAQRSAEAAKEIKELISTSRGQVEQGVALVTASGKSLGEIVAQVAEMSDVVALIAKSAREQAMSLREVSTAADQMDKVTQQNAAMVEETTAAAQNLSMETSELAGLVERFKTSHVAPVVRQPAAPLRAVIANDHRPVVQMRPAGSGGAALKSAPAEDGWEEF